MSLMAPNSAPQSAFQYCMYGYDKSKYSSFEDCLAKNNAALPKTNNKSEKMNQDNKELAGKINAIRTIAGAVGTVAGAGYAFYAKKGFWGYVGFMLLGGIVFGSIGMAITAPMEAKLTENGK